MNQKVNDNHRADELKKLRSGGLEKAKVTIDKVPEIMNAIGSGGKLKSETLNSICHQIKSCKKPSDLAVIADKVFSCDRLSSSKARILVFTISEVFTELGIAPAWRNYPLPMSENTDEVYTTEFIAPPDLRVIDLQWLHAQYRGDSFGIYGNNDLYRDLMSNDTFDYVLANKLATEEVTRDTHIKHVGVCEDIQIELAAYKTRQIEKEHQRIIGQREEVEKDLRLAATRNPRMGKKLVSVIPDRLDQWMSTQATPSTSKAVMYETYKKITGSKISLSSYNTKFQSLKNALLTAGNRFRV